MITGLVIDGTPQGTARDGRTDWIGTTFAFAATTTLSPALGLLAGVACAVALAGVAARRSARRAQRLRDAERLLEAAHRVNELRSFHDTLVTVAHEARRIVGMGTGMCFATGPDGRAVGAVTAGSGARAATADELAAIEVLAAAGTGPRLVAVHKEPVTTRLALPPGSTLVLAPPEPHAAASIVLAVVCRVGVRRSAAATLAALTGPAALAIANARLYEALDTSYREQLDLSRQKDEFVATVSHELRTPVAAIRGAIATVNRYADRLDAAKRTELLTGAAESGDRLSRIVEELLLVAQGAEPDEAITTVSVAALLDEVVAATASAAGGRVAVTTSPALEQLRTDGDKLRTVLVHLVENAAKFATDGPIELEAVAAGRRALFYVTDHGPGIRPEDRTRVFDRFVQLDQSLTRSQGGLGMGLHLAQQLAGLLGGEIVLTEAAGGGCCFCVSVARDLAPQPGATVGV